jgi:predicted secreted protein
MASVVNGVIEQIKIASNNTTYAIAASAYGICDTPSNESIKNVEMTGFKLTKGVTIHIKFSNSKGRKS